MSLADRDSTTVTDNFSFTLDDYGRLWLHAKFEGIEVAIDLADKDVAFNIMAEKMAECGYDHRPTPEHEKADNDDQLAR